MSQRVVCFVFKRLTPRRPNANNAPVPEPSGGAKKFAKKNSGGGGGGGGAGGEGDVTPRDGVGTVEAPSATRLTPSKIQTVTILVVRHQKPTRAAAGKTASSSAAAAEEERPHKTPPPPPPPVPVPMTFKRRVEARDIRSHAHFTRHT